MRESNPSKAAESSGWTAEKVRAIRTKTPNPSTASSTVLPKSNIYADALQQYTERHASDMGEVDARNEPSQARSGRKENLSPFPSADAARERSSPVRGATLKGRPTEMALDMGRKWGVPAKSGNVLENVGSGAMAYGSGPAQELRAGFAKDSVPDEFDRINQWMDTGDNKNLADAVRRVDNTHGAYTDADLIQKGGWTQEQIDEARKMNAALDAIPAWKRGVRRAANTIGGIGDTVAAAPVLGAEYGVQAGKNIDATLKNWKQVEQEVKGDEHAQSLFDLLTDVDMDYNPTWPQSRNRELISMGYNSKEIREMRQRLAGLEVSDGIDKNQSVGYQFYDRGQKLTAAAQSGLSPTQRAVAGAVTSAAENLAIAAGGEGAAWILPMLSAQGAAEAMGQSAEKGESAGKALGGGLAKFGAGWAINSVGAADLAKTMGSDYAKDTMAGQIADWVQGLAGSSELAQRYPAVAAAISGGIDNSMQAFAETYADMAIDAALGDSEAAKNLFTKDTFLTALESGLSGGASGALGGAVGSGLHSMSEALDREAERYDRTDRMKRAAAQQKEWEARAAEPSQPTSPAATENISGQEENLSPFPSADAARERSSTESMQRADAPQAQTEGVSSSVNEAAAQSENPAVRQFAEVAASDNLTGKTIGLFTPNAENRENRAAFEQAYGVTLPDTAGATRRMLREIAAQQNVKSEAAPAAQSANLPSEAASVPQTVQDTPAETADAMPETAAPDNVREAAAAAAETDSYENAPLRETLGLRPEAPKTQREAEVQRALEGWRVTDKAAETISKNMPDRVDADRYVAAASPLYRLGRSGADTFAQALELAGSMSGTAADINYILSTDAGRTALEIAYTQGKGERMLYAEKMAELGGALGSESTSGRGEVYAKGTMRQESDPASQIISLNAAATGTDAVLRDVLQNDRSVRAYVDTETARIFFGDGAQDIFGTVLHEDYHWYNALDAEGARTLQEHALEYLAKSSGYESLDEMVRAKLKDYSAQSLTYEQAAEELVADAWRGIFDSEESFKRWVTFQRGQAEKNAGKSGAIHKVMEQVRQMLDGLISRAKEVLTINPDNRAALKAKRLAEAEKRTLQDEYFAHAEKAMDNLRAAKENAAALKTESAAEGRGVRFQLQEGEETLEKQLNRNLLRLEQMSPVIEITGKEIAYGATSKENAENIVRFFESVGGKVERDGFGVIELTRKGAKATVQHGNGPAKQIAAAAIPEVIRYGEQIGFVENWKGRGYNTYTFVAPVVVAGIKIYEAVVVNEYRSTKQGNKFYVHEVCGSDGSLLVLDDAGQIKQKQESADTVLKTEEGGERPSFPANKIITQNDAPVKKNIRFQMASPVEVNSEKELVAVHNLTEENLREALDLGGMPSPSIAVVKAQDGHSKYGPISLVFGPDSIDPQASRANRVYGSDAWTPTRPNVEYEVNSKAAADFEDTVYEASQSDFEGKFANSSSLQRIGVDEVSSENREELAQKLQRDTAVQLAYLKAQGEKVEPIYRTEKEQFDSLGNDSLEKIIEYAGADELKKVFEGGDFDLMDKLADKAADALEEKYTHGSLEGQNRRWQMRINKLRNENRGRLYGLLEHAYKMMTDTSDGKVELDVEATREAIRQAAPEAAVKNWVKEQLGNVLGQKGIRNSKDRFTPGGKRRSFTELHNPYTLENLVAAMNAQNARGQDVWGVSAATLMSTTTAEYKSLDEVRADKNRLQQMPEEEYKALLEKADGQIEKVVDKLRSETEAHTDNSFEEREILGDILLRAAQGSQTAAAIGKAFAKEGYIIGKDTAQMIRQLYKDVAAIPTGYFEAKPQRAVGFDEVKAAVLPDNASEMLVNSLKEQGVPVYQYKAGDDAKRTEILNKLPNVRFQKAEQADRDAKQNQQRQASRVLAEKAAAFDTLNQFFGLTKNTRLSDAALESLAIRWTKTNGSRADRTKLANETRALVEYLRSEGADMAKAQGLAETLAGEVLDEATYRNTELWNQYPDLHDLTYTVDKNGKAKAELVKRYGSWTEAVAEARRHGVKLRQAEGYRDGNPAEQYEAIVNDTRAVGGVKESAAALFRSAAQEAGVAGAASMESTEWLDVLMNVHDTIKPRMMSRFADAAEYEDAKVELAGRMIGDIMSHPEMTDAEAVFEGILKHNREVAAMAAGNEERAAEVTKGLKSVQQAQRKAFADRMRANSRSQSDEVKSVSRAEQQLNENLETLGAQVSTAAGLDEKLTALREAYDREWKAEKKRMKLARQEMLDEIKLERQQLRSQINDLSRQVAGEQQRADRAERQLIFQENDILEWEQENQRKAEAWQQEQAKRNAIAIEAARQQRDEDIAVAKALAEKRVQKARDARKADELKRSIRNNAAQLNQMVLRPKPGKYVQKSLIVQAAEVAKLADTAVLNNNALTKLTALQDSIRRSGEMDVGIHADWENSGVENLIQTLRDDMNASKQAKLDRLRQQLEEAKALPDGDKAEQLRDRLRQRIRETENRTYLPMTVDQLRMLKAITASTLHMIRTENKTLSLARAEEVDGMAMKAAREVLNSEGNGFGEKFEKAKGAMNRYQLDMLGGTRMFRRLGGYTKNGQMEKLGQMLNDGQRRQTEILVEGESLFANVTGKEHLKEVEAFAGPGAELVDIGLKDSKGNAVPLNHAQLCSLYMLLRNEDSRHHLMTGGLTLPDAAQYAKGNIERAYQRSQTVMLGTLVNADGVPMADTILQTVQDAMTDYDRNWCKDMEDFFGRYTTNLINETSMKLLGYDRATVKNYYPIAVDRSTLATEIEGVKMDATIEGRGFLKERVKSDKPILLEECQNVVKRSLRDTAAYAGLAAPIRDVQRVLNSTVETAEGIGVLKDKIIGEKWGKETVSYINDLLTDLQTTRRKRSSTMSRALDRMRGNYAGAILTVNPGVAIAQAASLPTAGAVLGADTMAAVLPFVKNFSGKQRAAVEAEIRQHGDALLQYRLRGTKRGEMSSIGAHKNLVAKASEAMPAVTGWITGMDEITVAALWEGSKRYVERHAAEFGEGAAEKGSEAYWEAVNKMYQRVIEETQPNYTTMQRAGIQRSDNEFVKTLTMFTTQRFQNYGILADAVGDYKAQKARYAADQSAENKAEVQRAGQSLRRAAASQVVQTAVFALMKIGSDFLLHRWDKEQDENGDITAASVGKRFFDLYTESAAGNFLYGSEIYSALTNARDGKDYDVVSATNISAVNDLFAAFTKTVKLLRTDTGEMSEEELAAHHQKLNKAVLKDIQCGLELYGVPAANIRKVMQAFEGYWEDAQAIGRGEGFSFNSAPSSATGQYDRLYNAIQSGDSEEAAAAMKKLEQMNKTDKVDGELARRLKQYDADVLAAAKARNAGKARAEEKARKAVFEKLREGLDVAPVTDRAKGKTDAARRAQLIDLVNKAVDGKADELLAGGKDGSVYDALLEEVENGRAKDAQEELDRLLTAGKDKGSIKSRITEAVKEEYLAGNDRDREKLEKKLLALEDADENPLYEEKDFTKWVKDADKKAEKAKDEKNWWEGVK
ncbi:MAG: hypothetical protein KH315_12460 [Faecalibacterium prausnitzii]|uniref:Uncharacterized protein n=1 Tax=Faecalibacterium prausnitzii TaxID=853 RepID=A0A9E1GMD3_9FIRM|nr:hypothetical protein [Faecalibacterium prausnitzii]